MLMPTEPCQACYWSEEVVDRSKDIYLRMVDIISQHYSYDRTINTLQSIIRDIENCSVILARYFLFLKLYRETKDIFVSNFVTTDIEYFFGNIRSIYDLLQFLTWDLWKRATKINLSKNFHDMTKRDPDYLTRKYHLPEPLIKYYIETKDFFDACCKIRDSLQHLGYDIQVVFCFEDGFALPKKNPWLTSFLTSSFDIWPEEKIKENGLVSVLALISSISQKLLKNIDTFSESLIQSIQPLIPISTKYKVFFRGPYTNHLLKLEDYLEKQWIDLDN